MQQKHKNRLKRHSDHSHQTHNAAFTPGYLLDYYESGHGRLVPLVFHLIPAHLADQVRQSTKIELTA